MVCTISICAQPYINSAREFRDEKRLYQSLEILFIRFYFNRFAFFNGSWNLFGGNQSIDTAILCFGCVISLHVSLSDLTGIIGANRGPE